MMPQMDGFELLSKIKEVRPSTAVIMMTAFADVNLAVRAVQGGAYHFLTKPFASNDAVGLAVVKAAEHRRLLDRARRLEQRLEAQERFGELIGVSTQMQTLYRLIEGVANTTSTVLILGESGTGKELVARAIHQHSPRAKKPMVAVNCAAIPKELVESELFGHVRGAFTGANSARAGLFESADSGTIFLDEVGDLPLAAQVKLLRTLQEGEIKRVGSDETKIVDVRVVAATNVDLQAKVASGAFRRDLYYRLNVIPVNLPPLRERGDDTLLLAHHFIQKLARRMARDVKGLSSGAISALRGYSWPGNVRELEHALEHAFVLSRGGHIEAIDFPAPIRPVPNEEPITSVRMPIVPGAVGAADTTALTLGRDLFELPYADAKQRVLSLFDEAYVNAVLARCEGNTSEAARQAGLDRSNFRRVVRKARGES
jgi:DNA-binding NtrC family response regulator